MNNPIRLNLLKTASELRRQACELEKLADSITGYVAPPPDSRVQVVVEAVANTLNIEPMEVYGQRKYAHISLARHAVFFALRTFLGLGCVEIAGLFHRTPTGVLYAARSFENRLATDPKFSELWKQIEGSVRTSLFLKGIVQTTPYHLTPTPVLCSVGALS